MNRQIVDAAQTMEPNQRLGRKKRRPILMVTLLQRSVNVRADQRMLCLWQ